MVVGRQRNRAHGLLPHAMLVHEALHPHREALRRRQHAVRHQVGLLTRDRVDAPWSARSGRIAPESSERNTTTQSARPATIEAARIGNGRTTAAASAAPLHRGGAQPVRAQRSGQSRGLAAVVAVRCKSVDLARVEPGVLASRQDRLQRELELRVRRRAVTVILGLADADDRDAAPAACARSGRAITTSALADVGSCVCGRRHQPWRDPPSARRRSRAPRGALRCVCWPTAGAATGSDDRRVRVANRQPDVRHPAHASDAEFASPACALWPPASEWLRRRYAPVRRARPAARMRVCQCDQGCCANASPRIANNSSRRRMRSGPVA